MKFTRKHFFHTILGFTESYLRVLGDTEQFIQSQPITYKSKRPNIVTGFDKNHYIVIALMERSLMVSENQFCTFLLLVHHQDLKYTKNVQSNFLKR